jgi:hypothetical protein
MTDEHEREEKRSAGTDARQEDPIGRTAADLRPDLAGAQGPHRPVDTAGDQDPEGLDAETSRRRSPDADVTVADNVGKEPGEDEAHERNVGQEGASVSEPG